MLQCQNCHGRLRKLVYLVADLPIGCYRIDKALLNSDEIKIIGADWAGEFLFCPTCGWERSRSRRKPTVTAPPSDLDDLDK